MSEKRIVIIGAGIAGLSAACYARMNGYEATVFEMNDRPGGLCTSWRRGGYTIEGSLNYLLGAAPESPFHRIWRELGALGGRPVKYYDLFTRIESAGGPALDIHTDAERLAAGLRAVAPEDEAAIDRFTRGILACVPCAPPVEKPIELMTFPEKLRVALGMFPLLRRKGVSLGEFAMRFESPLLRETFPLLRIINSEDVPLGFRQMSLAQMHVKRAGYPSGGAAGFAGAIEERLKALGGEICYRARVARIIVRDDRAAGVQLADGSEHEADWVISAADGRATIFDMLGGRYVNQRIRRLYETPVARSLVQVAIGVNQSFEDWPASMAGVLLPLGGAQPIAGGTHTHLGVCIYNFTPHLAPPGRTLLKAVIPSDHGWWKDKIILSAATQEKKGTADYADRTDWEARKNLVTQAGNREQYEAEKRTILDTVVAALDRRFPGLAAQVEMTDVATPLTVERYTGNWKGSPLGWDLTTRNFMTSIPKRLPGLGRFLMAGQWVEPGGGIPIVALSGRNAVQLICHAERRRFEASEAG
jgi:phytoene dehydrogenase-like protein